MPHIALDAPRPLPGWLRVVASIAIAAHVLVFACWALHAPSGPWPTEMGPGRADPPYFAAPVAIAAEKIYLEPLRMTHNYHFDANRVAQYGVYFEVRLRDDRGQTIKTVKIPDDKAQPWARHRQALMAQQLFADEPVAPPGSEVIAAPKRKLPTVTYWDWDANANQNKLKREPQHKVPRDRPLTAPSEWSLMVAQAYMRHLCREHRAASAELVRHTREIIWPIWVTRPRDELPPNAFQEFHWNFGEYRRDR
jgi:hypothetical protein